MPAPTTVDRSAGRALAVLALALVSAGPLAAQAGDHAGEEQPPLPPGLVVPPAPALGALAELETFTLPPGHRIELVADEVIPGVREPVAMSFDTRGRLWVVEMAGYMPDVDGTNERAAVGSISVLEDADGDGRMERRTVFLDGLVLPRAVAPTRGGALVLAPPELLFCHDADGDLVADRVEVLERGHGGLHSPEHAINALLPTLDNAFHCANVPWRYVHVGGAWTRERTSGGGQWGATRDDQGRIFFDTNSDPLRGDLIPSTYAARNPNHGNAAGVNVRLVGDMSVRPARMTPGVNRGYQRGLLDERFRLTRYTAACAPWVHRADGLGPESRGAVFVCEPAGNLVAAYRMEEDGGGRLSGTPMRHRAGGETLDFLTSSDERFRPVALADGPDGALYVADMYRGVIQHRIFVTSFLRAQVERRGLAGPVGRGRIWRIVADGAEPRPGPDLANASWTEVVATLSHPSGWWRDAAQRILVEEGADSRDAHELTRVHAAAAPEPLGRLHALWALAGMGGVRLEVALRALDDGDPRVRLAAVRTSEVHAARGAAGVLERWLALARGGDARLRWQVLLSLGEVPTEAGMAARVELALEDLASAEARSALISGLFEAELEFIERLLSRPAFAEPDAGRDHMLRLLARAVVREGRSERAERLLELVAEPGRADWQREALSAGMLAGRPSNPLGEPDYLRLQQEPAAYARLAERSDESARDLCAALAWPGKPGVTEVQVRPLDALERQRFERGAATYAAVCAACHLTSGRGEAGTAPPLRGSGWVLGSKERLVRVLVHGLVGPLELAGTTWEGEMPALAASDEELADVLTYVRREWGHGAEPVTPDEVARVRAATRGRQQPWTADELGPWGER